MVKGHINSWVTFNEWSGIHKEETTRYHWVQSWALVKCICRVDTSLSESVNRSSENLSCHCPEDQPVRPIPASRTCQLNESSFSSHVQLIFCWNHNVTHINLHFPKVVRGMTEANLLSKSISHWRVTCLADIDDMNFIFDGHWSLRRSERRKCVHTVTEFNFSHSKYAVFTWLVIWLRILPSA
jgi:hypothetical protein